MIASYKWLKEYIDFDYEPKKLDEMLSFQGVEVDGINKFGGHIDNLVIGQVEEVREHPNADKLSICMVNTGKDKRQIICGAPNVRDKEKPKVIVALENCYLPAIDLKLKKTKIRGEESNGMIVSEQELGLAEKSEGIWLLPDTAQVGEYPYEFIPDEDYIIEYSPTSNRGDLLGMMGLAREIAAMKNERITYPEPKFNVNKELEKPNIEISAPDLCYRFTSRIIKGIKIGESPKWLKDRLIKIGQRPINNIVDISNYVMFETGHPNHIYDLNKLKDKKIVVRRAKEGEKITTLDDIERNLTQEMLVIADSENPVGLAGIMGSESSEVSEDTTDILLEAAYFFPHNIRKTSKQVGLSTEASYRFERIADINATRYAVERLSRLITEICGGEVSEMTDAYPTKVLPATMDFNIAYLERIAGHSISKEDTIKILKSLEFKVEEKKDDTLSLEVPTFKTDVTRPIDVVEEVARVYGYNNIPDKIFPITVNNEILDTQVNIKDKIRYNLVGFGLTEFLNFSFSLAKDVDRLKLPKDKSAKVINPISQDQELLRQSLIPNLIQNFIYNVSHGNRNIQAFELGHIFESSKETKTGFAETNKLGIILSGNIEEKDIHRESREVDFYDMKGIIDMLMENLGISSIEYKRSSSPMLHSGKSADVIIQDNMKIGMFGVLNPLIAN
ncbi:MAG: phenylalanine--tRNA ligase subunit beta, partial [Spirochaetota bacterium]